MSKEELNHLTANSLAFRVEFNVKAGSVNEPSFVKRNDEGLNRLGLVSVSRLVP
jgi:hypothetical protein